jgi:outer membrane protein assembly factor BamB
VYDRKFDAPGEEALLKQHFTLITVFIVCALLIGTQALAQRGAGDWMTGAYDAQRSSWVRSDGRISPESLSQPGFGLVWKIRLDNPARQLNGLTPPALIDFYIGYRGFRSLAFLGGSSDRLFAVDVDLGRIEWQKSFENGPDRDGTLGCPGGMTSGVTRPLSPSYPNFFAARGAGRGTPAKSGVGLPDEGAVTLQRVAAPPAASVPARPAPNAPPPPNPYAPKVQSVLALTGDGKLHSFWISNGEEPNPPVPFLPAHAHAEGLISYDNTAYVATTNGCGNVDNGVWALDLGTAKVTQWKAPRGGVAGTAGPAVRPNGTLYAAAGSQLVALAPSTLKPVAGYNTNSAVFSSSPVVFDFNGKDLVAVASSDGRLHLLDADTLGQKTPPYQSAVFSGPDFPTGSLTSWRDPAGTRWILAPAGGAVAVQAGFSTANGEIKNGAIVAWKVVDKGGSPVLEPGWISRDLVSPFSPAIVNGVVFALSSGEFRSSDPQLSAAQRAQRSKNAVLYALDALNGREIWNSGNTISAFVHSGGLAAGGGRIYVSSYEGTQYAFGFPMEH